jgi:glycosyltransferase involved in cell wall biosynthesis
MKRVVIASVLKPVTDTRMYEKIAKTLAATFHVEVHVIGHKVELIAASSQNILLHPVFEFSRLSIKRFLAWITYLQLLFRLKPDILIVTTHELLFPSVVYKLLYGGKIVYDVQENYFHNIIYTNTFPKLLKYPIAISIRCKEILLSAFVTQFILAERCYVDECELFLGKNNYDVIENKFVGEAEMKQNVQLAPGFKMVYAGTIAESYGIWEAIHLSEKIHEIDPNVTLTIIGFSPNTTLYRQIYAYVRNKKHIRMIGGDTLVAHEKVLQALKEADLALLSYQFNLSTNNRIPTKIYECLALSLPMLIPQFAHRWNKLIQEYNAGLVIDFETDHIDKIYTQILNSNFYNKTIPPSLYWWDDKALVDILESIILTNVDNK